jgi:hypothetical protein
VGAGNSVTVDGFDSREPTVVHLSPAAAPGPWTTRRLPLSAEALLSPRGDLLAFASGVRGAEQIALHEIASGNVRQLGAPGIPLAWSPDGNQLLVHATGPQRALAVQALDGSAPMPLPTPSARAIAPRTPRTELASYLFGAAGPLLLERHGQEVENQGERPEIRQRLRPTLAAFDLATGSERAYLDGARGLVPDHVAPTPDRRWLLAWTVTCPGLGQAYCGAELHRIALPDGSREVVLRTRRPGPVALARDGRTLAMSGADGVFVTTLP